MAGRPSIVPKVRALTCPNCGGGVELRGYAQSINAVCIQCLTILDATTPSLRVLQTFQAAERVTPLIPLGARGKWQGVEYEVIGFQVRTIEVDGVEYSWEEYLLLNPYRGYRYLTHYQGHWNVARTLRAVPVPSSAGKKRAVVHAGAKYTHFQTAMARTSYVMGEFPWQVRVGETVQVEDFIAPPGVLSAEITEGEAVWSIGEYTPGKALWEAFQLKSTPPAPVGIYANQPSPYQGRVRSVWITFVILLALWFVTTVVVAGVTQGEDLFQGQYSFTNQNRREHSFVTPAFDVKGSRPTNIGIDINSSLTNDWAYFSLALINSETGVAYDTGKEISYYSGSDSDGAWSEGSQGGSVTISRVPPGPYYLRVEPDMEDAGIHMMHYDIKVRSGATTGIGFVISLLLLFIPPIAVTWRAFSFENARWAESDYGALVSSSSSSDDDGGGDEDDD